jgi:HAD superfamily hydrolase (TIGR01509 family)
VSVPAADRLPQAVLFDLDGTIVDTEPLWMAAEGALAERSSAPWTTADAQALIGASLADVGEYVRDRMGLAMTAAEIVSTMMTDVAADIRRRGAPWRPGAVELLRDCNRLGVPTAVVTMSYRSLTNTLIEALPPGVRFDVVVAGDEVVHGKPHPEPYRTAAHALGVDPGACIAIEDSPTGAASAEAAGCRVIVVPNQVDVPLTPRRRALASLSGCSPYDLAALVAAPAADGFAGR